jgi:hypothetical protein
MQAKDYGVITVLAALIAFGALVAGWLPIL